MNKPVTARLESRVNSLTRDRDWYVLTEHPDATDLGDCVLGFFPGSGDDSLKACETWLENRGFTPDGDTAPECFEYTIGASVNAIGSGYYEAADGTVIYSAPDSITRAAG